MTVTDTGLLTGEAALVTGASRGIGAAIATAFGRNGAAVAVNYRHNAAAAEAVVADVTSAGGQAIAVVGDASDDDQVAAMVDTVRARFGDITVLACNAVGDTKGMAERTELIDDGRAIRDLVDLQLASTLAACRHVVPGMRHQGHGSIVLIGAAPSRQSGVRPGTARIGVVKAAQDAVARHLAAELGPDGIRVNVVAPGMVPTDQRRPAPRRSRRNAEQDDPARPGVHSG
jgi:3-oxoacyl-[acyl-carrier protein] reductase